MDGQTNRLYLDPLFRGDYPDDVFSFYTGRGVDLSFVRDGDLDRISVPIDFLGINYYFATPVRDAPEEQGQSRPFADLGARPIVPHDAEKTAMGWPVEPEGLTEILVRIKEDYADLPIYVTENGRPSTTTLTPRATWMTRSVSPTWTPTSGLPTRQWSRASICAVTWSGLSWITSSGPRAPSGSVLCSWSTERSGASPSRAPAGTLTLSGATGWSRNSSGKDGTLEYRDLGQTGMRVSEISLGTWAFGGDWGTVSEDDAYAALDRAVDLGVNFLDTADVYGDGRSENSLAGY